MKETSFSTRKFSVSSAFHDLLHIASKKNRIKYNHGDLPLPLCDRTDVALSFYTAIIVLMKHSRSETEGRGQVKMLGSEKARPHVSSQHRKGKRDENTEHVVLPFI